MKIFTKELKEKILQHFIDNDGSYQEEEVENTIEVVNGVEIGKQISSLDNTLIIRLIDDEELYKEIEECSKKEKANPDPFS